MYEVVDGGEGGVATSGVATSSTPAGEEEDLYDVIGGDVIAGGDVIGGDVIGGGETTLYDVIGGGEAAAIQVRANVAYPQPL